MSENEEIFEAEEPVLSVTEFVQDLDQVVKEKILEVYNYSKAGKAVRPFNECQVFELSRALLPHQKELMIELKRKRVKCAKDFSDPSNNPVNLAATHTKTKNGKVPHPDFPRVTTLRDTTESCIELYGENMAGLFDSGTALSTVPGTGKTMMALSCLVWYYNRCIREHIENPGVSMIVVPANLVNGWLKEIFINTNIPPGFVRVVTAGKDFPALDRRRPCIIIVSYSMIRDCFYRGYSTNPFAENACSHIVADEAHEFRTANTGLSKAMLYLALRNQDSFRLPLSGTFYWNRAMDIQPIAAFMLKGPWTDALNWKHMDVKTWDDVLPYQDERKAMVRDLFVHRDLEWLKENIGMHEAKRRTVEIVITGKQLAIYEHALKDFSKFMEDVVDCVESKWRCILFKLVSLYLISDHPYSVIDTVPSIREAMDRPYLDPETGDVYLDDKGDPETLFMPMEEESAKITALIREMHSLRKKSPKAKPLVMGSHVRFLVIVCWHLTEAGIPWCAAFGSDMMSIKARRNNIESWENAEGFHVLIGSIGCIGQGHNLQAGSHVYHLNQYYSPSKKVQAEMRVYRMGNKKEVEIVDFLVTNGIEDMIWEISKYKGQGQKIVMEGHTPPDSSAFVTRNSIIRKKLLRLKGYDDDRVSEIMLKFEETGQFPNSEEEEDDEDQEEEEENEVDDPNEEEQGDPDEMEEEEEKTKKRKRPASGGEKRASAGKKKAKKGGKKKVIVEESEDATSKTLDRDIKVSATFKERFAQIQERAKQLSSSQRKAPEPRSVVVIEEEEEVKVPEKAPETPSRISPVFRSSNWAKLFSTRP